MSWIPLELTRKHKVESYYMLKGLSISQPHYVRNGLNVNTIPEK